MYEGGKNGAGVYQKIINQVPPHDVYWEACVGGGGVILHLKPAPEQTLITDIDPSVIRMWEALGYSSIAKEGDMISILKEPPAEWANRRVFAYFDPPYLRSVRSHQARIYRYEFDTPEQHQSLLDLLLKMPSNWMIAISGYDSKQYNRTLKGWRKITFTAQSRRGPRRESLWMNYPTPLELHDYRYLGDNYRERERIAKRKRRWVKKIRDMDTLERYAILDAVNSFREGRNEQVVHKIQER